MRQLRIERTRQGRLQLVDLIRDSLQSRHMGVWIAPAFLIANNGKAFPQRFGKIDNYIFHWFGDCALKVKLETPRRFAQACIMNEGGEQRTHPSEPKRFLMVDDDVTLLRIVREALTSCLRCEVDTSPKPDYAFELALKKNYDLFLFDFQMPMIDGAMLFFLIGKVYNNAQPPRDLPPLLLISGKADEERAQELLKEPGVAGLIAKPFPMNRLLDKAKQCVPGLESLEM